MAATRTAEVVWEGSLDEGGGTIESVGSGAVSGLDVTWASRTEEETQGKTSPEELIAAAHASCFSMAFSKILADAGSPPQQLRVHAQSTFVPGEGMTTMELDVRGRVPGMDEEAFRRAAEDAKEDCPVSQALKGNVDIRLTASLEQG
jgi:osmotically inducible protein OsmC